MKLEPNPNFFRKDAPISTTPEQMREAVGHDSYLIRRSDVLAIVGPMANSNSIIAAMAGQAAYDAIRAIPIAPQPVAVPVKPLTAADLSEALSCFWNAAIGASHNMQDGIVLASIMAEGIAAVQIRLQEIADTQSIPTADPLSDTRVVALVEAVQRLLQNHDPDENWQVIRAALRAIGGEA